MLSDRLHGIEKDSCVFVDLPIDIPFQYVIRTDS